VQLADVEVEVGDGAQSNQSEWKKAFYSRYETLTFIEKIGACGYKEQ
jgi:hypothetical protein